MKFLSWWKLFFFNSTSQQQNKTPLHSKILGRKGQFNKSTAEKSPIYEIFELVKMIFSQFNKSTAKRYTSTFVIFRQDSPIQQVNGQKNTCIGNFWVGEIDFLQFNKSTAKWYTPIFRNFWQESTNQQVNGQKRQLYMKFLSWWNRFFSQFNKSTAKWYTLIKYSHNQKFYGG